MFEKLTIKQNVFSEAFPPNEKGERNNLLSFSPTHYLLNGITINPEKIIYKPLTKENLTEVKNLHKEWFPINYDDDFFEEILFDNGKRYFTIGAFYNINFKDNTNKEIILGSAFCEHEYIVDRLNKYIDIDIIDEEYKDLNKNKFEELTKCFKCQYYKCIYIMTIGVLDEFRKMNIGSNLIKYIYNIALEIDNCIGVYLHVICYNDIAIKFYKKNNFKKVNKISEYYYIDGKYYDSFVFLRMIRKEEKEEYKININNEKLFINKNQSFINYINKKRKIIKFIILILFTFIHILMEYKLNQKL